MKRLERNDIASAIGTSAKVVDALINDVRTGRIREGEPFPTERELSERFQVSRPAVRQAFIVLGLKGFAVLSSARRPRAAKPSIEQLLLDATASASDLLSDLESLAHLEQVRLLLELSVVRHAATNATNVQVFRLYDELKRCQDAIGDKIAFREADIAFHRTLVETFDNPILLALHQAFIGEMFKRRPDSSSTPEQHKLVFNEHKEIFEAIKGSDAEKAASIMERHLTRSYLVYREMATVVERS